MTEQIKDINKKDMAAENIAWARFLYKQYKKKKLKEIINKQEENTK